MKIKQKKVYQRKAQVSLEFLVVVSMMLILFILMGIVVYQKYAQWSDLQLYLTGRNIAKNLAENINQVSTVGEGYSEYFTISPRYPGDEFNITFKRREPTVFVNVDVMSWQAPLLTAEVYCCLKICDNSDPDKVVMKLNQTLKTRVINYQKKIYIGRIC